MTELHLSIITTEKAYKDLQHVLYEWISKNEEKIEDIYYNTNEVKKDIKK